MFSFLYFCREKTIRLEHTVHHRLTHEARNVLTSLAHCRNFEPGVGAAVHFSGGAHAILKNRRAL